MNQNNKVLNVIKNILPTLIIAISFFIIGRVSVLSETIETKNDKPSSRNTAVVLAEDVDSLKTGEVLKISSILLDEAGSVDTVFIDKFTDKIYVPHPEQLFIVIDLSEMTVYTRLDKTIHYGFEKVSDINDYLAFIFPKTQAFKRKLTEDEKKRFKIE